VGHANDEAGRASRRTSAVQIVEALERMSLVTPVPFDDQAPRVGPHRLVAVGLGVTPADLDPAELLQSHAPDGVLCYFTALALHELTTQPTAHQHVARRRLARTKASDLLRDDRRAPATGLRPAPLGQWQFTVHGTPYYLTFRDPHNLVGTEQRLLSDKARVTVTTLEQTLLDTLHRPMSCGGPPVVFEAWETAPQLGLDVTRMAALLTTIGDARLARRTGWMLQQIDLPVPPVLDDTIRILRAQVPDTSAPVPALAGMPYRVLDATWHLLVP
jgi:hypothetical protein